MLYALHMGLYLFIYLNKRVKKMCVYSVQCMEYIVHPLHIDMASNQRTGYDEDGNLRSLLCSGSERSGC